MARYKEFWDSLKEHNIKLSDEDKKEVKRLLRWHSMKINKALSLNEKCFKISRARPGSSIFSYGKSPGYKAEISRIKTSAKIYKQRKKIEKVDELTDRIETSIKVIILKNSPSENIYLKKIGRNGYNIKLGDKNKEQEERREYIQRYFKYEHLIARLKEINSSQSNNMQGLAEQVDNNGKTQ